MEEKEVLEWLSKVSATMTKVKVGKEEKEKLIKADKEKLKKLYNKFQDYEKAGLVYVCETLKITPSDADKVFRNYALCWRKRKEKEDGSVVVYVDLPIYPMSGHLKYYAEKSLPIARGWYGIANALCKLNHDQEERILNLIEHCRNGELS